MDMVILFTGRDNSDSRAVSSVISVILMVAVAVIIASVVAVFALGIAEDTETVGPETSFNTEYENGRVKFTHSSGDTVNTEYLKIIGDSGVVSSFSGKRLKSGETISYAADPGETVRVVWKKRDESRVLDKYTVPESAQGGPTKFTFDTTSGDSKSKFLSIFTLVDDGGTANPNPSSVGSGGVRCAVNKGLIWKEQDSAARYERTAPSNNGKVEISFKTRGCSAEDSGIRLYAVDSGGNEIDVFCAKSNDGIGSDSIDISCPNGGLGISQNWDTATTKTVTAKTGSIEKIVLLVDYDGNDGGDEIQLIEVSADEG